MPDPYTRAFNVREKARQEKNQWKARARKAESLLSAVRELLDGTLGEDDECTISRDELRAALGGE